MFSFDFYFIFCNLTNTTGRSHLKAEDANLSVPVVLFFWLWRCDPTRVMTFSFLRFLDHTQRRTTVGRSPLDEWSARRRDLYLTTHDTHNRQTSMPPVGFEPTISAGERPQTYALDRAATGTGPVVLYCSIKRVQVCAWVSDTNASWGSMELVVRTVHLRILEIMSVKFELLGTNST
jgi:hypothetical protein